MKIVRLCFVFALIFVCGIILYVTFRNKFNGGIYASDDKASSISSYSALTSVTNCSGFCTSNPCVKISNLYLNNMDEGVDPCEDAFAFACGRFENRRTYNDLQEVVLTDKILRIRIKEVLESIEAPADSTSGKLKTFYESCIDTNSELKSLTSFSSFLEELGIFGWPNLDETFRFKQLTAYQALAVYQSYDSRHMMESGHQVLHIDPPHLRDQGMIWNLAKNDSDEIRLTGSEKDVPTGNGTTHLKLKVDESRLEAMYNESEPFLKKVLRLFGVNESTSQLILDDFREVETSIIEIQDIAWALLGLPSESLVMTLNCSEEVDQDLMPLCEILKHFVKYNELEHVYSKSEMRVMNVPFFKQLFERVENFSDRTLANFLAVELLLQSRGGFYLASKGNSRVKWRHCVKWAKRHLTQMLRPEYVKQVILPDLDEIHKIVDFYIGISAYIMKKQTWIEESERLNFSDRIQSHINKLDNNVETILNSPTTDIIFSDFKPSRDNFFANMMKFQKNLVRQNLIYPRISKVGDIFQIADPFTVNAYNYFNSLGTELLFGILLPPYYVTGLPKLLNFALLGDTVGHELGHEIHSYFGDLERLSNETKKHFLEKQKCLEDQYSSFEIKGLGLKAKGNETFGEDLGDLIGVELTEKMTQMFIDEQGESSKFTLPALNYTYMQMIHIASAQTWCAKLSTEAKRMQLEYDVHSLDEIRVTGKAKNSKTYSQVFKCQEGSNMNPVHKCSFFENIS